MKALVHLLVDLLFSLFRRFLLSLGMGREMCDTPIRHQNSMLENSLCVGQILLLRIRLRLLLLLPPLLFCSCSSGDLDYRSLHALRPSTLRIWGARWRPCSRRHRMWLHKVMLAKVGIAWLRLLGLHCTGFSAGARVPGKAFARSSSDVSGGLSMQASARSFWIPVARVLQCRYIP